MPAATEPAIHGPNESVTVHHARRVIDILIGTSVATATPINMEGVTWAYLMPPANAIDGITLSFSNRSAPTGIITCVCNRLMDDGTLSPIIVTGAGSEPGFALPPETIVPPWLFIHGDNNETIAAKLCLMY